MKGQPFLTFLIPLFQKNEKLLCDTKEGPDRRKEKPYFKLKERFRLKLKPQKRKSRHFKLRILVSRPPGMSSWSLLVFNMKSPIGNFQLSLRRKKRSILISSQKLKNCTAGMKKENINQGKRLLKLPRDEILLVHELKSIVRVAG